MRAERRALIVALTTSVLAAVVAAALLAACERDGAPADPATGTNRASEPPRTARGSLNASIGASPPRLLTSPPANTQVAATPESVVTITAVGDLALGATPVLPADPSRYLLPVTSALAAPIVFGNLEGALTNATSAKCAAASPTPPSGTPKAAEPASPKPSTRASPEASARPSPTQSRPEPRTCYAFRVPPSYASILRADGFTVLNSANNHAHDFGARGVADTTAALRAAGIAQTGLPGQVAVVSADGVRVAFVGFAPYANSNNLLDVAAARHLIASARHRADLVVVYMHAGAEGSAATHVTGGEERYLGEDRGNPEAFAHAAIEAGADLVVASGPHVLRGMQYYRGHLIAYSLGDFAGFHNFSTAGPLAFSGILRIGLAGDGRVATAHFTSTVLDAGGRPAIDPGGRAAGLVNQLSAADFGAGAALINASGDVDPAR